MVVRALLIGILLLTSACHTEATDENGERTSEGNASASELQAVHSTYEPEALEYLEAALDTIEAHHIHGADYDWMALRRATLERAEGAEEPADTYEAIRLGLADIGDRHGSFQPPRPNGERHPSSAPDSDQQARALPEQPLPELTMRERVAHLEVPFFMGQDEERVTAYASRIQAYIRTAKASGACGWIVDLRGNGGGNMWPMIAGLGPLLGEGGVGAISGASDEPARWIYASGQARLDTTVLAQVDGSPVVLSSQPPVAVLTDERTGSSGEAVAIAFRGRDGTRSFGAPTGGAPTQPGFFALSDGAVLSFSIGRMVDRTGNAYDTPIEPDERTDQPVAEAIGWLKNQKACRSGA